MRVEIKTHSYTPHIDAFRRKVEAIRVMKVHLGIATEEEKKALQKIAQVRHDVFKTMFNSNMKKALPYGTIGISEKRMEEIRKEVYMKTAFEYAQIQVEVY